MKKILVSILLLSVTSAAHLYTDSNGIVHDTSRAAAWLKKIQSKNSSQKQACGKKKAQHNVDNYPVARKLFTESDSE